MSEVFSWDGVTGLLAFVAVALLGAGYLFKGRGKHLLRIGGWVAFGLYWPTQSMQFFYGSEPDPVNGYFTLLSPLFFLFLSYHEWQSWKWGEDPRALRWITGTSFIAAATYFAIYRIPGMTDFMIGTVAYHSAWMATHAFGVPTHVEVDWSAPVEARYNLYLDNAATSLSAYAVTIILACTAVQSIMIFVGAIATTEGASPTLPKRRWLGILYTAFPIYVLNLVRNAGIVWGYKVQGWTCCGFDPFEFWHSYVGKGGSLIAMVIIALAVFKTLPELHENILDLFDLPKRRKPGFYSRAPAAVASAIAAATPPQNPTEQGE